MKIRIRIHRMNRKTADRLINRMLVISQRGQVHLLLLNRAQKEFVTVRLLATNRSQKSFDIAFDDADYNRMLCWARNFTHHHPWDLSMTVSVKDARGTRWNEFKVHDGTIRQIASRCD